MIAKHPQFPVYRYHPQFLYCGDAAYLLFIALKVAPDVTSQWDHHPTISMLKWKIDHV